MRVGYILAAVPNPSPSVVMVAFGRGRMDDICPWLILI